jgi:hypothetical protein
LDQPVLFEGNAATRQRASNLIVLVGQAVVAKPSGAILGCWDGFCASIYNPQ